MKLGYRIRFGYPTRLALLLLILLLVGLSDMGASASHAAGPGTWSQLQNTPQRTGYTDDSPSFPYSHKWTITFWPETIAHNVQVITDGERAYVGTKHGVMHAVSLANGQEIWQFQAGGAILHTAAEDNGFVYFAAMDGAVYQLNAATGAPGWKFTAGDSFKDRAGFSTAVLLAENKIFAGNRRGLFFAIAADTGQELWRYDAGAPVFNSAAYDQMAGEGFGRIVFGAEDMHVYCLNSNTGQLLWRSDQLSGKSMRDYHPVIVEDKVIVRTFYSTVRSDPYFSSICPELSGQLNPLLQDLQTLIQQEHPGVNLSTARIQVSPADLAKQNQIADFFAQNPLYREFYVLELSSGAESYVPSVVYGYGNNGVIPPPVADPAGNVYLAPQMVTSNSSIKLGGGPGKPARLDMDTGRIAEWLPNFGLYGTGTDETTNFSIGGNILVGMHHTEGWTSGAINLATMLWREGMPVGTLLDYPYTGNIMAGGNSASISGNTILHNRLNSIVAVEGN